MNEWSLFTGIIFGFCTPLLLIVMFELLGSQLE